MIIRTETYRDLEEDIATICDCVEEYLYETLSDYDAKCSKGIIFDNNKFYGLLDEFIDKNADLDLIDEIYVYHLGRHFNQPIELMPLKQLLLSKNSISDFLAEKEIMFAEEDGQIKFYYKEGLITPDQLMAKRGYSLLARRLGYIDEPDFCINGFTFWPDIESTSDGYYNSLRLGPEFIGCIERYLGIDILREFRENSNYYGIVFKVPLNEIIFDDAQEINNTKEKARLLVKHALMTLHGHYFRYTSSGNNPILRINDSSRAKVDHCILIKE